MSCILEGTRDSNIGMIDEPRRLAEMVSGFGDDINARAEVTLLVESGVIRCPVVRLKPG